MRDEEMDVTANGVRAMDDETERGRLSSTDVETTGSRSQTWAPVRTAFYSTSSVTSVSSGRSDSGHIFNSWPIAT